MGKTLDYATIGAGLILGVLLIVMAIDTARRMNLDVADESEASDD